MPGRWFLLGAACLCFGSAVCVAAEPERPALTLQLAKPIGGGGDWAGGALSGSAALDLPRAANLSVAVVLGTVRGLGQGSGHSGYEIDSTYLAAGLRYMSPVERGARMYLLGAVGLLHARLRDEFSYWDSSSVSYDSSLGATALLAFGVIASVPGSRCSFVAEAAYLAPAADAPGNVGGRVPTQLTLGGGLRVALGR